MVISAHKEEEELPADPDVFISRDVLNDRGSGLWELFPRKPFSFQEMWRIMAFECFAILLVAPAPNAAVDALSSFQRNSVSSSPSEMPSVSARSSPAPSCRQGHDFDGIDDVIGRPNSEFMKLISRMRCPKIDFIRPGKYQESKSRMLKKRRVTEIVPAACDG
jgi:hypothetical protein